MWHTLLDWWPVVLPTIVWGVSIERRLAGIRADLVWIKKKLETLQ